MKIYYLLSDIKKEKGFEGELKELLYNDIKGMKKFVAISTSPNDYEKNDKYFEYYKMWFKLLDSNLEQFELLDNRKTKEQMQEILKQAEVVLLCGGNTLSQIQFVKENELDVTLRNLEAVILGISAGSINMACKSFYSKDKDVKESIMYNGIGLVDITIEPHFDLSNKEVISDAKQFINEHEIIGLPNGSSIRIEKDKVRYIGKFFKL